MPAWKFVMLVIVAWSLWMAVLTTMYPSREAIGPSDLRWQPEPTRGRVPPLDPCVNQPCKIG